MEKLYRHHRGALAESLATVIVVNDFSDIEKVIKETWGNYCSNLKTVYAGDDSYRAGEQWKATYYVVADFQDGGHGCIGMCNFPKE